MSFQLDLEISLSLLEIVCGLLIIGTLLKSVKRFNKLNIGKLFILFSGVVIVLAEIIDVFDLLNGKIPDEIFSAVVYLFFALGLSFFYKKKIRLLPYRLTKKKEDSRARE